MGLRSNIPPGFAWIVLGIAVSLSQGCARSGNLHRTDADAKSPASAQEIPFQQNADHAPDYSARPALPADPKPGGDAPFRSGSPALGLPAGTLVTVQLETPLAISQVRAGEAFTASLAGPIIVNGYTLVQRGTPVSGRVESAQLSAERAGLGPDPGYVRLTLNAITVDGRELAVQTSSLFARGTSASGLSSAKLSLTGFVVSKGRRLTFRLTAPVPLADPNSIANRQAPRTAND
jgi:hypothetical protein